MGSSEYLDEAISNQGQQNFKKDIFQTQTQRARTRAVNSNKSHFIGWSAKLIVKYL